MKTLRVFLATTAFAAGASADSFYHEFAQGNQDLRATPVIMDSVVAAQPGVGDSFDRYHGLDEGNGDLFSTPGNSGEQPFSKDPDIYGGFYGNY